MHQLIGKRSVALWFWIVVWFFGTPTPEGVFLSSRDKWTGLFEMSNFCLQNSSARHTHFPTSPLLPPLPCCLVLKFKQKRGVYAMSLARHWSLGRVAFVLFFIFIYLSFLGRWHCDALWYLERDMMCGTFYVLRKFPVNFQAAAVLQRTLFEF